MSEESVVDTGGGGAYHEECGGGSCQMVEQQMVEQQAVCCERPCCLKNTFTAEVENGVWQGGLGFGTKPLRTDCFYPTADGDWFPITPRIKWTPKHCLCNDSCCCGDNGVWIERAPWDCCDRRPVCCSTLELKAVDTDQSLAVVRYEPVLDDDGQVVYKRVVVEDEVEHEENDDACCSNNEDDCGFIDDEQPSRSRSTCGSRKTATLVARRPTKLLSLVAPPVNESYNFQRPVVRQYSGACSVRSIAPAGTRFYGTSSFANEVNSQKWPGGYEPRSGAAICGFLL